MIDRHRRAMAELAAAEARAEQIADAVVTAKSEAAAWKAIAHELLPAKPANVVPLRRPPAS